MLMTVKRIRLALLAVLLPLGSLGCASSSGNLFGPDSVFLNLTTLRI